MRISDWSSDVCSSDLGALRRVEAEQARLDLGDGEAGDGAGELFRKDDAVFGDRRALEIASALLFFAVRVQRGRATSLDFARDARCFSPHPTHPLAIVTPFGPLQPGLATCGNPGLYPITADH